MRMKLTSFLTWLFHSKERIISIETSLDRAKATPTRSIDKMRMTTISFTTINYEE